jgi:aminopeptidase N
MKRFAHITLVLLWASLPVALARDNYARPTGVDAEHYRIRVEIKDATDEIRGETEIVLLITDEEIRSVALDFGRMAVDEVKENNQPARFTHAEGKLNVALQGSYRRGDHLALAVKYHGTPSDGLYIKKNKFGDRSIFADNWPDRARHWFPAIDHPYDKATVEFLVVAPDRYDVVANGVLLETESMQNGAKLTHWSERVPIPTYCMVIGATEFSVINASAMMGAGRAVPIFYYLYPKDRAVGIKAYGRVPQMLEYYTRLIGPYPYEKLALVQSSTRFGGMENSSSIFFDEKAINASGQLEGTVAHEIAHQWFGDSVTESDWHHLWLSEGFATYFGYLFFGYAEGRGKFIGLMLKAKERYFEQYAADPRPIHDPAITKLFDLLNRNNYEKGGWVLHMLRRVMGDEQFFAGVRDYYRAYRDRNALTADFQKVMEARAGRSLDWFFKQWIYEPGYPVLDASWRWDEAARQVRLTVRQKQKQEPFQLPLDVEIKLDGAARREVIEIKEREQAFSFKLDARPQALAIDPDEWALKVLNLTEEK